MNARPRFPYRSAGERGDGAGAVASAAAERPSIADAARSNPTDNPDGARRDLSGQLPPPMHHHNAHRIDLTGDRLRRTREKPAKKD
jgi:hypothetical protein